MNTPPRICPNCYGMWFEYSADTLVTLKFGKEELQFRSPANTCKTCGEVIVETRPPKSDLKKDNQ